MYMGDKMSSYNDENVFKGYLNSRIDNNSPHNKTIKKLLLDTIGDYKDKTILDLGCGIGCFTFELADKAKKVVGIDISSKVIKFAIENNSRDNIEYMVQDITKLNDIKDTFDIVFSDMVFNYIEDYDNLLNDINNHLNENGLLVFSQVHPISTASLGESSWITENNQLKFQLDNYCNVSKRERKYFDGTFDFYHRRFEELINIALKNGFIIEKLYEPYITEKEYNRPSFLIIKLRKK